jgi:ribonuclease P protein component
LPGALPGSARAARLTRRIEFEAVYRNGIRRSSAHFVVFCRANAGDRSRYGFSISRQTGGAVVRNRIRRRLREIVRRNSSELPTGWDIVIHPRRTVAQSDFARLTTELLTLVRSAASSSKV